MNSYSIDDYKKAGCKEIYNALMLGVHGITDGRVCDTGCHAFNNGGCQAYKILTQPTLRKVTSEIKTETVKEESLRRGISISEVRRQRRR